MRGGIERCDGCASTKGGMGAVGGVAVEGASNRSRSRRRNQAGGPEEDEDEDKQPF